MAAALEVCPERFYDEPRLFGLYADCIEGRAETTDMLYDAYMRRVPVAPIVPPAPPPSPGWVPHYNPDTGQVRRWSHFLCRPLGCVATAVEDSL